jgi:hypothetical protein
VYVRDGAPNFVRLDKATRHHIELDLAIDKRGKVRQSDITKVNRAFETAFMKVFNQLKFEFMPRFLVSEEFGTLLKSESAKQLQLQGGDGGGDDGALLEREDMELSAFAVTASVDIAYLVTDPYGLFYAKEFLHSRDADGVVKFKFCDEIFELLLDIDNYHSYTDVHDKTYRLQRMRCIIQRYGRIAASMQLQTLEEMVETYVKASSQEKLADNLDIFAGIREEALRKLDQEFLPHFKESR